MPKGKRYILVEVDVNVVNDETVGGQQPNNLSADSEHCLDSMCADFAQYGYADGTHVYGVQKLHPHNVQPEAMAALHLSACKRKMGALGKECDRPSLHHDSDNKTFSEHLGARAGLNTTVNRGEG